MSDEIFRLLPVLISAVSHYKLPHSENGNGWRWTRKEGGRVERRKKKWGGGQDEEGPEEEEGED